MISLLSQQWAARGGESWLATYWASRFAPHRDAVLRAVYPLAPFASLREIGCHCGPNLARFAAVWPEVRYIGMDINAQAVRQANDYLLTGVFGTHPETRVVRDGSLGAGAQDWTDEVVLACYTLAYALPDQVEELFQNLGRNPHLKALVIAEPMGEGIIGPPRHPSSVFEINHDYVALASETWRGARVWFTPVEPAADRLTTIMTLEVAP